MHPTLNIAISAARNASKIILRSMGNLESRHISEKQRNDFVTEVDKQAEKEIIKTLRKTYPNHKIIGEESGTSGENEDYVWIIDPLDGTTNYIRGIPHFAISIAMQYKDKLEQAVIYDPVRDELFVASRGEGARLNDRRIRVSQSNKLESALLGTGFPFRNPENIKPYLNMFVSIMPMAGGIRRAGSAALDLAYVAAGRLDGFWELSLAPWDIAAGALLITEAGGMVSDLYGEENFLKNGNIVAGNPKVFEALLSLLKKFSHHFPRG